MNARMRSLILNSELCVLATTGAKGPHASLMSYLASEDAALLYFVTKTDTLKYSNIQNEPRVSILIDDRRVGDHGELNALTISGRAERVKDTREEAELLARFTAERPHLCRISSDPDSQVFRVVIDELQLLEGPTEITYETQS
jgi:nitroimidazol reductase NimA-like FMN-containing flavoprotein (pyridoxamine 5'-phosphate oxidase superfamily)